MHDIFISYSSVNQHIADTICGRMEYGGLKCWYAPRDIAVGEEWPAAIMKAIQGAKVFVLIYSANSNQSKQVIREVAAAVENECTIVPFRIDDTPMCGNLSYYLSGVHWMDASHISMEQSIENLYTRVWWLIHPPQAPQTHQQNPQQAQQWQSQQPAAAKKKSKTWLVVLAAIALLAVVAVLAISSGEAGDPATGETQTSPVETQPTVQGVQPIVFEVISHYDDCFYPFADFYMFTDSMDAYFLETLETGNLWLWKTDIDTPIIADIPMLPWDPFWMRAVVTDSKEFIYFVDELYGRVQCYDTINGTWCWEEPASLNLTDTEYIDILRNSNNTYVGTGEDAAVCFLVYDVADTEQRYTRVVKLYPDGSTKTTDIRHLNLVTYISNIDKSGCFAIVMLDTGKNVSILDLTTVEVPVLSNAQLLQDYLQYSSNVSLRNFFNKTGQYLCTLNEMNGRQYYTVRNMETGKTREYNYDYADVCFVGENSLLVFNQEDYSLTVYNLETNQSTQLLDVQYFQENDAYSTLPSVFQYLEELNAFLFLNATDNGIVVTITDMNGNVIAQSAELETLFEQNDVYFALENNELFLSVRSQSLGEAFEDDVFGSVYNLIYRVAYTHNAQGELIFIQ